MAMTPSGVCTPVTRRRPPRAAAVRNPRNGVRSRSCTPACCIASEYARTFRGGSIAPSVAQ